MFVNCLYKPKIKRYSHNTRFIGYCEKKMLFFTVAFTFILLSFSQAEKCDEKGVHIYKELGCKPQGDNEGCPAAYECEEYKITEKFCRFRGHKIDSGENIPSNLTIGACKAGCLCREGMIICAVLDCPEWLNGVPLKSGCHRTYELNGCCAEGVKCVPEDDNVKCEDNGKAVKSGQKFTPEGTCMSCICKEGFNGKLEEPYCQPTACGFEEKHARSLENNCAPLYFFGNKAKCCPDNFICDENKDVIVGGNKSEHQCKFGDKKLNVGDYFKRKDVELYGQTKDITCTCKVPPYLICLPDETA